MNLKCHLLNFNIFETDVYIYVGRTWEKKSLKYFKL